MPEIPAHLSDEARAEWSRVAQELFILGILSQVDRVAFAAYCEAWADWVDACKKCAIEGFTIVQPSTGNIVMNPHFNAKTRAAELMHKFLTEFGMTPASRTRINAPPKKKKKDDKWEGVG